MKRAYIPIGCDQQGRLTPTIRRHPRTMQEAFGPYTSNQLEPMSAQRRDIDDAMVVTACIIGFALLLLFYSLGWI